MDPDAITADVVLDVLQRLVDKSMVDVRGRGGERRYRMLQTVRQYGDGESEGGPRATRRPPSVSA